MLIAMRDATLAQSARSVCSSAFRMIGVFAAKAVMSGLTRSSSSPSHPLLQPPQTLRLTSAKVFARFITRRLPVTGSV